jgi:hypothetical protein
LFQLCTKQILNRNQSRQFLVFYQTNTKWRMFLICIFAIQSSKLSSIWATKIFGANVQTSLICTSLLSFFTDATRFIKSPSEKIPTGFSSLSVTTKHPISNAENRSTASYSQFYYNNSFQKAVWHLQWNKLLLYSIQVSVKYYETCVYINMIEPNIYIFFMYSLIRFSAFSLYIL